MIVLTWIKNLFLRVRKPNAPGLVSIKTKPVLKISARIYRAAEDKWYDEEELK